MSKGKKKFNKEDVKNKQSESTSVNKPRIAPSSKDVVTVVPGTNIHKNSKGQVVIQDEKGVYKPLETKKATITQGKKKTPEEYIKEQETIEEMQSNDLGLRAPLYYLANPTHVLGDLGNVIGFKPLQNFFNSDEDAKRYNYQSLDPSKSKNERFQNNLKEGLNLVPSATFNLGLASLATKTPFEALKEAYNPIPLPFNVGMKVDPTDYWKNVENQSDSMDLLHSQNIVTIPKKYSGVELEDYNMFKKMQDVGLLRKETDITKLVDNKNLGDNITKAVVKKYNTYYRGVGNEKLTGKPLLDAILNKNIDVSNLKEVAKYKGTTIPFEEYGARQTSWNDSSKDLLYAASDLNSVKTYGDDVVVFRPNTLDFSGTKKDWLNNNLNPKVLDYNDASNYNKNIPEYNKNGVFVNSNHNKIVMLGGDKGSKVGNAVTVFPQGTTPPKWLKTYNKSEVYTDDLFPKDFTKKQIQDYKEVWKSDYENTDVFTRKLQNTKFAQGGNLNKQNNNNMLTEFNTGGTHEQNKLGGIPQGIGQNGQPNTVEEGETKKDNFVYSDRLYINEDLVKESNLPGYIKGKTFANASKAINDKFKDRNDIHSNATKKELLDRLSEAQEYLKMQEQQINQSMQANMQTPEYPEQNQMFLGGDGTPLQVLQGIGASGILGQNTGINQVTTALDLSQTAFGKSGIDTSGATDADPGAIKPGMMGLSGAAKGAQAGMMFGPWGATVGGAIGLTAGLIGGSRAKKDALKAHQNFEIGQSNQKISNFAFGGNLIGEPLKEKTLKTPVTKEELSNLNNNPSNNLEPVSSRNRKMVGLQSGVFNDKRGNGYYYYYDKKPGDLGFNPELHRNFVTEENHSSGQRLRLSDGTQNPLYNYELHNYLSANKPFALGGNMYEGGGPLKPWRLPSSTMYDDPNYSGGFGFKPMKGAPYASELPLDQQVNIKYNNTPKGSYYKNAFNQMGKPQIQNNIGFESKLKYNDPDSITLTPEQLQENNGYSNPELAPQNKLEQILGKVGQYAKDNYGNALRYAPVAMNAYQLAKMGKPEVETLDRLGNRYNPQYMDERALTNQINAETNYGAKAMADASNGSLGALRNNILGVGLNKTKALSNAYAQAAEVNRNENKAGQQFNLGVNQINMGQSNMEKDINARNRGAYKTEKSRLLGQIGTDLGNIGKEEVFKKQAEKMTGYSWMGNYINSNPEYKSKFNEIDASNLSEQEKYARKQILFQEIYKGMTPEQIEMYNKIQTEVSTMGHPKQKENKYGGYITPKFKKY